MHNFLDETINILKENGKTQKDVTCVSICNYYTTWAQFKELIKYVSYDSYSCIWQISAHLYISGDDWTLKRSSCRGTEYWSFEDSLLSGAGCEGKTKREFSRNFFINPESNMVILGSDSSDSDDDHTWDNRFLSRP